MQWGTNARPKLSLANILPPPRSLEIKTVKLLTDPVYLSYQSHTATLSLMTSVYIKYAPPAWGPVPRLGDNETSDHTEWKRRVKMYRMLSISFRNAPHIPPASTIFSCSSFSFWEMHHAPSAAMRHVWYSSAVRHWVDVPAPAFIFSSGRSSQPRQPRFDMILTIVVYQWVQSSKPLAPTVSSTPRQALQTRETGTNSRVRS